MRKIWSSLLGLVLFPVKFLLWLPFKILIFFFDALERLKQENDRKKQWMKDLAQDKKLRQNRYRPD